LLSGLQGDGLAGEALEFANQVAFAVLAAGACEVEVGAEVVVAGVGVG
jgi:hypothetical protein